VNVASTLDSNSSRPLLLSFLLVSDFPSSRLLTSLFLSLRHVVFIILATSEKTAYYCIVLLPAVFSYIKLHIFCSLCLCMLGWEHGTQEGTIEWDEDWDKFEDEG